MEEQTDEFPVEMEIPDSPIIEYPRCPISFQENQDIEVTPRISKITLIQEDIIGQATNLEFLKSSKISPDGSQILTVSETNYLTTWQIPNEIISNNSYYANGRIPVEDTSVDNAKVLKLKSVVPAGESIYDYCWYPGMTAGVPSTCCVLVTTRDHPLQLWDVEKREIRCKYSGFNHLDELEAAQSIAFNIQGDKIVAGYNRMIRLFDASCPGKNFSDMPTCKSRSDRHGQKGIISCISFSPTLSGVYAAGAFSQTVGLYSEHSQDRLMLFNNLGFGVTHVKWSPSSDVIWIGGRKNSSILCFDARMPKHELGRVNRPLFSNQRLTFDIDPWGKYLFTGTQDGRMLVYDTLTFDLVEELDGVSYSDGSRRDCINSVSVHPFSSLLIGSSGQRHFDDQYAEKEDFASKDSRPWIEANIIDNSEQSVTGDAITRGIINSAVFTKKEEETIKYNSGLHIWQIPFHKLVV